MKHEPLMFVELKDAMRFLYAFSAVF